MIQSKIFTQYSPISALHLHPRHYTCLIQVDQHLFYYDCFSSIQLWSYKLQQQLMLAFSLDFNKIYALQHHEIITISDGTPTKICNTTISNPDYFILHDLFYIFVKQDQVYLQNRETGEVVMLGLPEVYEKILMLEQVGKMKELFWVGVSERKVELVKIDLAKLVVKGVSSYEVNTGSIKLCKVDEINKNICLVVNEEITILNYKQQIFHFQSKANYDRPIRDIAFFHFAENTSSVGGNYKTKKLLILANQGEIVDLLEIETGVIKGTYKLSTPVGHIYFNRLFHNSFITLSAVGEVSRVNLFGYEKEWVCLGFKFVEIENNEVYEEKEDDFEVVSKKKKMGVTVEDLDDSSLSLFTPEEMLEKKVKRIGFKM